MDRPSLAVRPIRTETTAMGTQRTLHRPSRRALQGLGQGGLAWFLAAWLVSYTATNGLSVMFAVAMIRGYGAHATLPTTAYAIGVGCSLLLYRSVGGWDARFGPWRVLSAGLAARALLIAAMAILARTHAHSALIPILVCFAGTQIVWPLLSVASNALAVTLSGARQAESVGLLNAATSLGAAVGGIVGGILLRDGFAVLCAATLGALLLALVLATRLRAQPSPA